MTAPMRHRASDEIWGLVCGFPEPARSNRPLLMLKAYVDDSNMNALPVSVLGGWVATAAVWASFVEDWDAALKMRPALDYFKLNHAQTKSGGFGGWSDQSRDERLLLLLKVIERHQPLGIVNAIPTQEYRDVFGGIPDRAIQNPYFVSFFGITSGLVEHLQKRGHAEPIDFIFDIQPGQVELVTAAWERFVSLAPPDVRPLLGDYPIFRSDARTLPLQAADMLAGWSRQQADDAFYGRPRRASPWKEYEPRLTVLNRTWSKEMLQEIRDSLDLSAFGPSEEQRA